MFVEAVAFAVEQYPALLIFRYTINALTENISYDKYVGRVSILLLIVLGLKLVRAYVNTARPVRDQSITEKLFNRFFKKCMEIDYQTLETNGMQKKMELAKYIANGRIAAVGWYFVEMISSFLGMCIGSVFILSTCPAFYPLIVVFLLLQARAAGKSAKKAAPVQEQKILSNRLLSYLYEIGSSYRYAKEFRLFGYKGGFSSRINQVSEEYAAHAGRLAHIDFCHALLGQLRNGTLTFLVYLVAGGFYLVRALALDGFTFLVSLTGEMVGYASSFVNSYKSYLNASAYIKYYTDFMDAPIQSSGAKLLSKSKSHVIEFQDVFFRYPGCEVDVLQHINLRIVTPVKLALVGKNGAGKSSFVKLLLRLYRPSKGKITLDGVDIFAYSQSAYLSLFSSVFQDFELFAFTVLDNITALSQTPDLAEVESICQNTGVTELLQSYPDGYATPVSNAFFEHGVEFSGGEQQKIAMARSLYKKNAMFFLLDEPLSTYDADAEYLLYQNYAEVLQGRSAILISHRLSSCRLSDQIIVIEDGTILEKGSHSELMKSGGFYQKMFTLQAEAYCQ